MQFTSDIEVRLVDYMGTDLSLVAAARVSTAGQGAQAFEEAQHTRTARDEGLLNSLMRDRHGTPFEHAAMTFFVAAPIFVFREFHRHRIGWSYNEESGRYKELAAKFYTPGRDRPGLMQVPGSKAMQYAYEDATEAQWEWLVNDLTNGYIDAYNRYEDRLARGYAKEVARMGLPVAIFSSQYATCNPRSLMSFLSLRTKEEPWQTDDGQTWRGAKFPSKPQYEINVVADKLEEEFATIFPITHRAFLNNGRVAP